MGKFRLLPPSRRVLELLSKVQCDPGYEKSRVVPIFIKVQPPGLGAAILRVHYGRQRNSELVHVVVEDKVQIHKLGDDAELLPSDAVTMLARVNARRLRALERRCEKLRSYVSTEGQEQLLREVSGWL